MPKILWFLLSFGFFCTPALVQAEEGPTQEDIELSKVPKARIAEPRLKKIYETLGRQYKSMYSHAAADGYIVPNEKAELNFQRRMLARIQVLDEHHTTLKRSLHLLTIAKMDSETHKRRYAEITKELQESEATIRRFACRHIDKYPQRNPSHCPRSK